MRAREVTTGRDAEKSTPAEEIGAWRAGTGYCCSLHTNIRGAHGKVWVLEDVEVTLDAGEGDLR
jgi:hypothetical protein